MRAGVLIVDIAANLARLQSDMGQAKNIVETSMRDIKSTVDGVKTALETLGVTVGVGAFAALIKGTLESEAALLRLAQQSGTTVEVMSSLSSVAHRSSTELDSVAQASARLLKNMAESSDGTTKAAKVFDALGISTRSATGELRAAPEIMQELGSKLMSMRDQGLAAAFATEVLGKNGAAMIPFLYELAQAGELHASVTKRQAEEAKIFADSLHTLSEQSAAFARSISNDMLPTLQAWLEKIIAIREAQGGGFIGAIAKLTVTGDQAADPAKALGEVNQKLDELKTRLAALNDPGLTHDLNWLIFGNLLPVFSDIKDTQNAIAYAEKQKQILESLTNLQRQRQSKDPQSPFFDFAGGGIPIDVQNPLGQSDALTKRYTSTLQSLNKEYFNLTNAGQFANVMYEVTEGTLTKLTIEQKAYLLSMAGQIDDYNNLKIVQKEVVQGWTNEVMAVEAGRKAIIAANEAYYQQNDNLKFSISLVGQSSLEIEKANAVRQIELKLRQDLANLPRDDAGEILPGAVDAMDRLIDLAQAQKKKIVELVDARQKAERDWLTGVKNGMNEYTDVTTNAAEMSKKVFLDTFQGMEDALVRFVQTGKLNFGSLVNTIEADLIRIAVRQQITGPLAANAGGLFGSLGGMFGLGSLGLGGSAAAGGTAVAGYGGAGDVAAAGAGFSWAPPIAAAAGLYYAQQSGLADRLRANSITGPLMQLADPFNFLKGPGGPKDPTLSLNRDGASGSFWLSQTDLLSQSAGDAMYGPIMQALNDRTKYDQAKLATLLGTISAPAGTSASQLVQSLLAKLAPAALPDLNVLTGSESSLEQQLAGIRRALPGQLGISSLEQYQNSLAVSSMAGGPTDQLAAARSQYDATLAKAKTGDLTAINSFPQVAQTLLSLGQSVFASGSQFQDLFKDVNTSLQQILDQQRQQRDDILKDVPAILLQNNADQIKAVQDQTTQLVTELKGVQDQIRQVKAAIQG